MYEQDYIMRLIHQIVRFLCKVIFGVDTDSPTTELIGDSRQQYLLNELLRMADQGQINEAENALYDLVADSSHDGLAMAVLFYSHLNEKSDEFLEEHRFSREEIMTGIQTMTGRYGISGMEDLFS